MTDQPHVPPVQGPTQGYWAVVPKKKGFIPSLFDLSFDNLITPGLLKLLFVLAIIVETLVAVVIMIAGYSTSVGTTDEFGNTSGAAPLLFLAAVLFAVTGWCFAVLGTRVVVESVIVRFKSNEYLRQLATKAEP